ncbi:MAG: GNAT family N-acetyltransferase [Geminicoccaceae bacterium]
MSQGTLVGRLVHGIAEIDAAAWDALVPPDNPFLAHAFLAGLEASGSAATRTGWQPLHLVLEDGDRLIAAAPMYAKSHSYGEYVFDHGWADGYERAGGSYYPKLQVAVPFTPVPGTRLLARDAAARAALVSALRTTLQQAQLSSLHVTFCTEAESRQLGEAGFLQRRGIQFHWTNQGYGSFADFMETLRSAKKKMVRKERQQVAAAGVEIQVLHGDSLTPEHLDAFFPFYRATVDKRWGNAYLTRTFFRRLGSELRDRVVLVSAVKDGKMVGAALNVLGDTTLYGRLWGCLEEYKFLHFEACYYAAIEFAILRGLQRVEAGAQGVHKLHRGYAPVFTHSAHLITDPSFKSAVKRFLDQENESLDAQMDELRAMLPYRSAEED